MTTSEIGSLATKWNFDAVVCEKSLHEISKIDKPRQGGPTHCLENRGAGLKKAIWFDQVMADWVNLSDLITNQEAAPHRIDGCYVDGDDVYLVEFKADADFKRHKDIYWAKFHDCLCQILDRRILTFCSCQEHLYYIVVVAGSLILSESDIDENYLKRLSPSEKTSLLIEIINPFSEYMQRPWLHDEILPKADLRVLTAFSCKKAWTMNVVQFDRFVQDMHWT